MLSLARSPAEPSWKEAPRIPGPDGRWESTRPSNRPASPSSTGWRGCGPQPDFLSCGAASSRMKRTVERWTCSNALGSSARRSWSRRGPGGGPPTVGHQDVDPAEGPVGFRHQPSKMSAARLASAVRASTSAPVCRFDLGGPRRSVPPRPRRAHITDPRALPRRAPARSALPMPLARRHHEGAGLALDAQIHGDPLWSDRVNQDVLPCRSRRGSPPVTESRPHLVVAP